jgi:hypothetical protein
MISLTSPHRAMRQNQDAQAINYHDGQETEPLSINAQVSSAQIHILRPL